MIKKQSYMAGKERRKYNLLSIINEFQFRLHPPRILSASNANKTTHLRLNFEGAKKVDEEEEIIDEASWWVDDIFWFRSKISRIVFFFAASEARYFFVWGFYHVRD